MSDPMGGGPMRPFTDDPKTNVLYFALLGCACGTFLFIVIASGAWRWLALAPIALGILLFVKIVRRAKKVDPNWL